MLCRIDISMKTICDIIILNGVMVRGSLVLEYIFHCLHFDIAFRGDILCENQQWCKSSLSECN